MLNPTNNTRRRKMKMKMSEGDTRPSSSIRKCENGNFKPTQKIFSMGSDCSSPPSSSSHSSVSLVLLPNTLPSISISCYASSFQTHRHHFFSSSSSSLFFFIFVFFIIISRKDRVNETQCDYFDGEWVRDARGPLYDNGSACEIKKSQNCILNGRPDTGYLYWRWKPNQCHLPRFEPLDFLQLVRNKHVAFVGDSFARNQFQSLLCMLVTASTPKRVFKEDSEKWYFPTHNANLTLYWSPFLVQGVRRRKVTGPNCNTMYLDRVHERWARDVNQMDVIVLSFGVWFLLPSVYTEGGSVLGSFKCPEFNHTRIMDFYEPLGKSVRTSLNRIFKTKGAQGSGINIIVKTFSPAHFEGDWDKGGTCSMARPYRKKENQLDGVNAEIRRILIEEVENAKPKAKELGFKLEALDVT
ncbi:hypothetical protein OROGR_000530 [Orobanche gracilis]